MRVKVTKANLTVVRAKINIKNKINKNVAMLLLSNVMDILLMVGTLAKGGKKYSASTIITKNQKLYPHWLKKYKVNTNYFFLTGLG